METKALTSVASRVPAPPPGTTEDAGFAALWLRNKLSQHTRRAYAADIARSWRLWPSRWPGSHSTDLQALAEHLGRGSAKPATINRALTAVKSLLSFGQEAGYLAFNVGAALKLRPNRDNLAQRILEESEIGRLIDAAPAVATAYC